MSVFKEKVKVAILPFASKSLLFININKTYQQPNAMYRNSYLQLYKTTANSNPNISLLLTHFNQIYNTLGCVLQDLQFQVGKIIAEQAQPSVDLKQQYQQFKKHKKGDIREREKEKEVIKVEEHSMDQNVWKNMAEKSRESKKNEEVSKAKGKGQGQEVKKQDHYSQISGGSWIDSFISKPNNILNEGSNKHKVDERRKSPAPEVAQHPRSDPSRPKGNDSFDSLFESTEKRKQKSLAMEIEQPRHRSPLPSIPQASLQHSSEGREGGRVQASEQDFFQRIFKEGDSRRSK